MEISAGEAGRNLVRRFKAPERINRISRLALVVEKIDWKGAGWLPNATPPYLPLGAEVGTHFINTPLS